MIENLHIKTGHEKLFNASPWWIWKSLLTTLLGVSTFSLMLKLCVKWLVSNFLIAFYTSMILINNKLEFKRKEKQKRRLQKSFDDWHWSFEILLLFLILFYRETSSKRRNKETKSTWIKILWNLIPERIVVNPISS